MKKLQIILDVEVSDDTLTPKTMLAKWKASPSYEQLLPGVQVVAATAHILVPPTPAEGVKRSLADVPGISGRLLRIMRNASVLTVEDLASVIGELHKFQQVGKGTWKEAISIVVRYGGQFNKDELPLEERAYATHLLGLAQPDPNGLAITLP